MIDVLWSLFPYWWLVVVLALGLPIERWYQSRPERRARERLRNYGWDGSGRIPPPIQ